MARMQTRKHGKSKSRKPPLSELAAEASSEKKKEIEELIISYSKQGIEPAKIGQILKDKHGVKYVRPILGMRLGEFLEKQGITGPVPSDLLDLMRKAVNMRDHLASNHKDIHNKVKLVHVESKILRLEKYYKKEGKLPESWHYDPKQAALLIKS